MNGGGPRSLVVLTCPVDIMLGGKEAPGGKNQGLTRIVANHYRVHFEKDKNNFHRSIVVCGARIGAVEE